MAPTPKKRHALGARVILRYGLIAIGASLVLTSAIYASQRFEQFLIRDPRFFLAGPADYGLESANLELEGVRYASRAQVLRVFDADFGRSLFLFPLKTRRNALLNVRWVRDASIVRIWPNRIRVQIRERQPAAFVKLQGESMARWALIDDEGVILDPPQKASFHLPMLSGVQPGDSAAQRGARVRRAQRVMQELASLAEQISEVDVNDLDDVKVTEKIDGRAFTLMLGDHNFSSRLKNFLDNYPDIHRRIPQVTNFDLRLDDRITGGGSDAR